MDWKQETRATTPLARPNELAVCGSDELRSGRSGVLAWFLVAELLQGDLEGELRPDTLVCFADDRAAVLVDDDIVADREALPSALPDYLGRKERIKN